MFVNEILIHIKHSLAVLSEQLLFKNLN